MSVHIEHRSGMRADSLSKNTLFNTVTWSDILDRLDRATLQDATKEKQVTTKCDVGH